MPPQPLVYELNTRCWLRELSRGVSKPVTLANVPTSEFEEWRRLGFTDIWLMGVWTTGPRAQRVALASQSQRQHYSAALPGWQEVDVEGSPYAIADYDVPAPLGGLGGLQRFRELLHESGIRLILDFVPNHLGLDHAWLSERSELFVQAPADADGAFLQQTSLGPRWLAHGRDPNFPSWKDTVQLDYRRTETRNAMVQLLQKVAGYCDGVRCDMAMLLLSEIFATTWKNFPGSGCLTEEFWPAAIDAVKQVRPDFIFLAEAYWGLESRLQALGFDYTYDKILYDDVVAGDIPGLRRHLLELPAQSLAASAHFLENHDERRIASLLGFPEHRAASLLTLALPGMRLLHEGQLSGWTRSTPVQLVRRMGETPDTKVQEWYSKLLLALVETSVGQGQATLLAPRPAWSGNPTAENFMLILWSPNVGRFDLVVVNLSNDQSQCYAPLPAPGLTAHDWLLRDLLGSERYQRKGEALQRYGLYLDVPPHAAQLFRFDPYT